MMERVNEILKNKIYKDCLTQIAVCERERIFCKHNIGHFMDVARIAWILNLEEELNISKERIYATALLHDIGRHIQYREGIPHQEASARIAPLILEECLFTKEESDDIIEAIDNHRNKEMLSRKDLSGIIYRADKKSRGCYGCEVLQQCDWSTSKKNLEITY